MAILFDNNYYKIIKSTSNFVENSTDIEMGVYASAETRQREKEIYNKVKNFTSNVNTFLVNNISSIIDETNAIQPIDTIEDRDEFLSKHPTIKEKVELHESMQEEGLYLIDKLLKEDIDFTKLKYKEKWVELGLEDSFSKKIDYMGNMIIGIGEIKSNDLSTLYQAVKDKIVSEVEDC